MRFNIKILVLLTLIVNITPIYSQNDASLEKYVEETVKNNPSINQKYAEFKAALQLVPQVGSLPDPEFSAGFFLKPMELLGGSQVADLRLMQMFPWFGTLKYAKDEMSLMAKATFESYRDTKFQVLFNMQQTWFDLYKNQKAIEIYEKNLEILNTLERLSLIKFKTASISGVSSTSSNKTASTVANLNSSTGMRGMSGSTLTNSGGNSTKSSNSMPSGSMQSSGSSGLTDLYRIQIQISDLENEIATLKDQKTTLTAQFNAILNRDVQSTIYLPDSLIKQELTVSSKGVLDSILSKNPMLEMLNFEKQSLDSKKEMVTRMGYPMLGLGLNYAVNKKNPMSTSAMNGEDMVMPMVSLTIPIYRKKFNAMKSEVDQRKESTEFQVKAMQNRLKTEYFEVVQSLNDADRRITLYSKQTALSKQSLNIMIKSYSAGAGLTDLLIIQQQNLDYELKQLQALADYNTAIANLNRMMAYPNINSN